MVGNDGEDQLMRKVKWGVLGTADIARGATISAPVANAPFLYTEVTGDFIFRAKVRPNHR